MPLLDGVADNELPAANLNALLGPKGYIYTSTSLNFLL